MPLTSSINAENETDDVVQLDKNDPEVQRIITATMFDVEAFGKVFFPEQVPSPSSSLHKEIFRIMDDEGHKKKMIAAPRGLGKTTWSKIRACKAIVFREVNFIVYLSNSATSAEMQAEDIKRMLRSNKLLKALFGDIKIKNEVLDESFSKKSWTAFGEIFILPRGSGQQVRGLNWHSHRPELIIIDDLENSEEVRSEEQREKLSFWFFSDLMKTESNYGKAAEFLYIDTIKHEDSLANKLIKASDWISIKLSICDENFNSFDPNYMTTEELKAEYAAHKEKGKTDLFYMERMNIPISLEDAVFKPSYFKYFSVEGDRVSYQEGEKTAYCYLRNMIIAVIVDPAKTLKMTSADSAVVTVGVERTSRKIFVLDVFAGQVEPDQLYNEMFDAVMRWKAFILAVEVTSLHQFISQPIENEMRVRNLFPLYVELKAVAKKEERVAKLQPHYRHGYVYHNKQNCDKLELQLQWFPKSEKWDVMDALAYINKLMDEQNIYFDPGPIGNEKDEFAELVALSAADDEAILRDDWRLI